MARTKLREMMQDDAGKAAVSSLDIGKVGELVDRMLALQARRDELTTLLDQVVLDLNQVKEVDLPTMLDEVGVSKLEVNGHAVSIKTEYFPNVVKANEPEFFDWLRRTGHDDLIKREVKVVFGKGEDRKAEELYTKLLARYSVTQKQSVHPQTLRAFIREQMDRGANLPSVIDINAVRTTIIK